MSICHALHVALLRCVPPFFFFWSTHRVYYLGPIVGHRHNHGVQQLASTAAQYWQKHPPHPIRGTTGRRIPLLVAAHTHMRAPQRARHHDSPTATRRRHTHAHSRTHTHTHTHTHIHTSLPRNPRASVCVWCLSAQCPTPRARPPRVAAVRRPVAISTQGHGGRSRVR